MRVFLDFEASSLGRHSYPIEVAWVFENGGGESHLIKPAQAWTDWSPAAETIHCIPRAMLEAQGEPVADVAARMIEALTGHALYASAPSWDGKWMSLLLRAAGLPRHALRLSDSEIARAETAAELLPPTVSAEARPAIISGILRSVAEMLAGQPVSHRALADAEQERQAWLEVRRLAREAAGSR